MKSCFDPAIPTEVVTQRNTRILIGLIFFWLMGAIFPIIFRPKSYAAIKELEDKIFPDSERYKFDRHLYSNEVYAYIDKFAKFYSHKVSVFSLKPKTFKEKDIKVVRLRFPKYDGKKKRGTILALAGMYACVWDSVSAAIDLMHKLCEECKYKVPYLLEYEWYIIPILNPDGYDHSLHVRNYSILEATNPKNRVKFIHPNNPENCRGVYINRNFGFHWGESKNKDYNDYCWYSFAGLHPFSEKETHAIREFVMSFYKQHKTITMYIQIHGSRKNDMLTFPWRFTTVEPSNNPILYGMGKAAVSAVNGQMGTYFGVYQSGKIDLASGVLVDWLMGIMKIVFNFSIEPTFEIQNGTYVPDQQIYIEKIRIIVFTLVKHLRMIQSSAEHSAYRVGQTSLLMFCITLTFLNRCI